MRVLTPFCGIFLLCLSLIVSEGLCRSAAGGQTVFEVVGSAECADCKKNNLKTSQAFSGLRVTIDCKLKNGGTKRVGSGELDEQGHFRVSLPKEIVQNGPNLKHECYTILHSAAAIPCPTHNSLESSKITVETETHGQNYIYAPAENIRFSAALCSSKFFWPHFKYPPLPPLKHFGHPWHLHPLPPKPLPPPAPIYKPPPLVYGPKPPVPKPPKKQCPTTKPKPPVREPPKKPLPPTKPKPPVKEPPKKPLPPTKPNPPVKAPPKKPLPPTKPSPPVKEPPFFKPPKKPCPPIKPNPPVYKPPVIVKPLPPPIPLYPIPPMTKNPCPPLPKLPPFPEIPPNHFHHPKYGHFPPLPPTIPHA